MILRYLQIKGLLQRTKGGGEIPGFGKGDKKAVEFELCPSHSHGGKGIGMCRQKVSKMDEKAKSWSKGRSTAKVYYIGNRTDFKKTKVETTF